MLVGLSVPVAWRAFGEPWAFPPPSDFLTACLRALILAAGLVSLLHGLEAAGRRHGVRRWGLSLLLVSALSLLFFALAPENYFGDWKTLHAIVAGGGFYPKWFGASLVYGGFYRYVERPLGLSPLEAMGWTSSLCGALTAWTWVGISRRLGLVERLAPWPWLYGGTFGVVGLGLAHLEIYPLVMLAVMVVFLAAVGLLLEPSPGRLLIFSAVAGLAFVVYVGAVLLVPTVLLVLVFAWFRLPGRSWRAWVAWAAAALLLALPLVAAEAWAPEGGPLSVWAAQPGSRAESVPDAGPKLLPPEAHWKLAGNLLAPQYWLAPSHVEKMLEQILLDQLLPLALVMVLAASWLRRRRGGGDRGVVSVFAVTALVFGGWSWLVIQGMPFPLDWDLRAWTAVATLLAAAAFAGAVMPPVTYRSPVGTLLVAASLICLVNGFIFLDGSFPVPGRFGRPNLGLALGVTPSRLRLGAGELPPVSFWIENRGPTAFVIDSSRFAFVLAGENQRHYIQQQFHQQVFRGRRRFEPGSKALLLNMTYKPRRFYQAPRSDPRSNPRWRESGTRPPPGRYKAKWLLRLPLHRAGTELELLSPEIEVSVPGETLQ